MDEDTQLATLAVATAADCYFKRACAGKDGQPGTPTETDLRHALWRAVQRWREMTALARWESNTKGSGDENN